MKRIQACAFLLGACLCCFPQYSADSVKKGWNIGFLPAVSYDSDLGFFYGVVVNPFDYGDGSRYPDYFQQAILQLARYTGGSSESYLEYDSYSLIPGLRFLSRLRYVGNQTHPFYGFNGNESFYNHSWEDPEDPLYKSRVFYRQHRNVFQIYANVLDTIAGSRFQWHAGWEMVNYNIDTVYVSKLNRRHKSSDQLPYVPTLYELYTTWGIIDPDEREGGLMNSLLVGLTYDSRNQLTNPSRGVYTELVLRYMPSFINGGRYSALNAGFIHRQYINLYRERLILAYRVWLNACISGEPHYYVRSLLTTFQSTNGYGGFNTIRGALMQRIVTSDFIMVNIETRMRLVNFRFIKQNWYIGAILFFDAGKIVKPVRIDLGGVPEPDRQTYFRADDNTLHKSAGGGMKLTMNENFVLSAEFGKAIDSQDGTSGLYLGLGYLF